MVSRYNPQGNGALQRFEYDEKEEMVMTQRTPQSALLLIDSQDRYTIETNGQYNQSPEIPPNDIYINHQKLNGFGEIKRAGVTDVYFPWRTPNVNKNNNHFGLDISGEQYVLTVPEGFYKPSELAAAMQTIANSIDDAEGFQLIGTTTNALIGQPWTITTSPSTGAFTISGTGVDIGANFNTFDIYVRNLNEIINFNIPSAIGLVASYTGGVPSMAYTKYIDFVSNNLCKHQRLKDGLTQFNYTNIIYRLYLQNGDAYSAPLTDDGFFGSRPANLYRQVTTPKMMMWNKDEMISAIDIKLYDDSAELLYIPEKDWDANYLLTMLLSES